MSNPLPRIQIYNYCPQCGSGSFEIRHAHLTSCPECGLKLYHNPCGAAGAILIDSSNHVLLVRRANEPAKGKLAFPGGFVDDDESAEEALRRELMEEVGIDVTDYTYVCTHPNAYSFAGVIYPTLDIFYFATVANFDAAKPLDEVAELVVTSIDKVEIDELAFASTKAAWKAFRNFADLHDD